MCVHIKWVSMSSGCRSQEGIHKQWVLTERVSKWVSILNGCPSQLGVQVNWVSKLNLCVHGNWVSLPSWCPCELSFMSSGRPCQVFAILGFPHWVGGWPFHVGVHVIGFLVDWVVSMSIWWRPGQFGDIHFNCLFMSVSCPLQLTVHFKWVSMSIGVHVDWVLSMWIECACTILCGCPRQVGVHRRGNLTILVHVELIY